MAIKEYEIAQGGITYTVQLEESLAKEQGLTPKDMAGKPSTARGRTKNKESDELSTKAPRAKAK